MEQMPRQPGERTGDRTSLLLGAALSVFALVELLAWFARMPLLLSGGAGLATLKANTAACLLCCGVGLATARLGAGRAWARRVTVALGALVLAVAVLTLLEWAWRLDLGIDQALVRDDLWADEPGVPGRMSGITAVALAASGAALSLLGLRRRPATFAAQGLALVTGVIGFVSALGYVLDADALYRTPPFGVVALPSSLALLVLSGGLLFADSRSGLPALFLGPGAGGVMARRLVPAAVLLAPLLAVAVIRTWPGPQPAASLPIALLVALLVVGSLATVAWCARLLDRLDRSHAQAVRREREGALRRAAVFDSALDGIIAINAGGTILDFNAAAERILGFAARDVVGRPMVETLVPAAYRDEHREGMQRYLASGEHRVLGRRVELTALRADGVEIPVELAIVATGPPSDPVFVGHLRDISERRQAAESLRRESEFRRRVLESTVLGVCTMDVDGRYTLVNPRFCEVTGYPAAELLGESYAKLMAPEDRESADRRFAELLEHGSGTRETEVEIVRRDGSRAAILFASAPLYEAGRVVGAASTFFDLTERRELEARLREAQRLDSVGRLASGIAHDFNNLLTVILGSVEAVRESARGAGLRLAPLQDIATAGERAADLTRQLLAFARRQKIALRVLDLNDIVRPAESMLRRLLPENVAISLRLSPGRVTARVDAGLVEQVLVNLAVNARDAMPGGGQLTIETTLVEFPDGDAQAGVAPGEYAVLTVADTGTGIDESVREHIFEPFFTTKEFGKGTGLGLATCHGIAKQLGGGIAVASEPGRGSTFRVYLPIVHEVPEAPRLAAAETAAPGGTETLLVAEDEELVRRMIVSSLANLGYRVLEASNGDEALARARAHEGRIHLLVSDALMPRMSGRELAGRLRQIHPEVRVLFISGYSGEASPGDAASDPADALLPKPFPNHLLAARVREILDRE